MKLKVYLSVTSSCEMTSSDHVTQKMKVSVEVVEILHFMEKGLY